MGKSEVSAINLEVDKEVTQVYENQCLIGKILLYRPLDQTLVNSFTQREWKCKRGLTVTNIGLNMFMFVFQDKQDLTSVLKKRPWTIVGGLLMLSPCNSGEVLHELKFTYSAFWVQAHGLPLDYLTMQNGSKIGELLGGFVCTDWHVCFVKISCRNFLRLRVILDVRKPILIGFWLKRPGLPDIWIDFKYEKLGVFCYKCGHIGYNFRTCKFPSGHGKFGPWLRADYFWDRVSTAAAHPICTTGSRMVETRVDQNVCTTLLAVPRTKATLDQSSYLGDVDSQNGVDYELTPDETETIPRSNLNLWGRLIFNSIDSMIMLMNCTIIFSRTVLVDGSEDNWTLLILMAIYLVHLSHKFVRVIRSLRFLKAENGLIPSSCDRNGKAIVDILVLIFFLVMLVSF